MAMTPSPEARAAQPAPLPAEVEAKLDELVRRYRQAIRDCKAMRERERAWHEERAELLAKHEAAQLRIAAMIERLKQLEGNGQ